MASYKSRRHRSAQRLSLPIRPIRSALAVYTSEDDPLVIDSNDEWGIIDIDVGSFYPGLIRLEQIAPSHLDKTIYLEV